jgi:phosphoglycolate phosphatase
MPYQHVLFDFDGTLADSLEMLWGVANEAAGIYGFRSVTADEVDALRGMGALELIRHLGIPMWRVPVIATGMRRLVAQRIDRVRLFPRVAEVLTALRRRGIAVSIVTSNGEDTVRRVLGPEMARRIDGFHCGASLFGKARLFRRAVRASGIPADRTIAIGDELRDIEAARRAGIAAGSVTWGYATAEALRRHRPDILFDDVTALCSWSEGRA